MLFVPVNAVWIRALHEDIGQRLRAMWLTSYLWRVYSHRPELIRSRCKAFRSCGWIENLSRELVRRRLLKFLISRLLITLSIDTYAFPAHSRDNTTVDMCLSWRAAHRYIRRHHVFANLLLVPLVGAWIGHRLLFALIYRTFRHFNGARCLHMHRLSAGAGTATATPGRPLSLRYVVRSSVVLIDVRLNNLLVQNGVLVGLV